MRGSLLRWTLLGNAYKGSLDFVGPSSDRPHQELHVREKSLSAISHSTQGLHIWTGTGGHSGSPVASHTPESTGISLIRWWEPGTGMRRDVVGLCSWEYGCHGSWYAKSAHVSLNKMPQGGSQVVPMHVKVLPIQPMKQCLWILSSRVSRRLYSHMLLNNEVCSEKSIVRWFCYCGNMEGTFTSPDGIAYCTSRLYGTTYCSRATNLFSMLLCWIL